MSVERDGIGLQDRPKSPVLSGETPGQAYGRLVREAVSHTLDIRSCNGDTSNPNYKKSQDELSAVRGLVGGPSRNF